MGLRKRGPPSQGFKTTIFAVWLYSCKFQLYMGPHPSKWPKVFMGWTLGWYHPYFSVVIGPKQALKAVPKKNNKPNQTETRQTRTSHICSHMCWFVEAPQQYVYTWCMLQSWPCKQGPPSEAIWTNPMKTIMVWHCWIPPQLWVNQWSVTNTTINNRWAFYRPLFRGQWWFIIPSQTSILAEWARKGHDFLRQFGTWSMILGHRK